MGSSHLFTPFGRLQAFRGNASWRPFGQLRLHQVTIPQVQSAFDRVSTTFAVKVHKNSSRADGLFVTLTTDAPELSDHMLEALLDDMTHNLTAIKKAADQRVTSNLESAGHTQRTGSVEDRPRRKKSPARTPVQRSAH